MPVFFLKAHTKGKNRYIFLDFVFSVSAKMDMLVVNLLHATMYN
jgi:hypothetical protein